MKIILLLSIALSAIAPAWGRLGETEKQAAARYGPGAADPDNTLAPAERTVAYRTSSFIIVVGYIKGKSAIETFSHVKGDGQFIAEEITELERNGLLSANASTSTWTSASIAGVFQKRWERKDKAADAIHDSVRHTFTVMNKQWSDLWTQKQNAQEKDNVKGF